MESLQLIQSRSPQHHHPRGQGNITINSNILVAIPSENSNISANSKNSFGGQVIVNATGILGIDLQDFQTPRSDITASSDLGVAFSSQVIFTNPEVDISQALAALPTGVLDPSQQIRPGCAAATGNRFVVTGRGDLPPDPSNCPNR
jgi:large exoprotein involved in heme utilization and adhesion